VENINVMDITPEMRHEMRLTLGHIISCFKLDWDILRAVMVATRVVISGSSASAVLKVGEFIPQDLDIYVTSHNFATVLVFTNKDTTYIYLRRARQGTSICHGNSQK
jgi:hypothetical protein